MKKKKRKHAKKALHKLEKDCKPQRARVEKQYKLFTHMQKREYRGPGSVSTTYQTRAVATFSQAASLDLMKPLLAVVRARHRFVRWEAKPTVDNRKKLMVAWLRAKNLLAKALVSQTNPDPTSYQASVLGLCTEVLEAITDPVVVATGPATASTADHSQTVQPAREPLPKFKAP